MHSPAIRDYLQAIAERHRRGDATEHTYRGDLEVLLRALLPGVDITNEPRRITDCGAPDYVLAQGGVPLGYIEAKDLGKPLGDLPKRDQEQFRRYLQSLDNFILTDYLDFRLYRAGESTPVARVDIAELQGGQVKPKPANFAQFTDLVTTFGAYRGQTITTAVDLARRMADKARMLAQTIIEAFNKDAQSDATATGANPVDMESALQSQLDSFRAHLIHDLAPDTFADIYAQTVAYGMFAARLRAPSSASFTRREAAELIPSTNPFLRKFFQHIAGYELDARIRWIVDDLAGIFRAADVAALMKDHGKSTRQSDPFIHFYETFLAQYDPRLRKSRGVYYTPEPVVNFIVRAVDDILRVDFDLTDGLAATATTRIKVQDANKTGEAQEIETHKVQILDPATGTGTFLAAIVKEIYARQFTGQHGNWQGYVAEHLLPRLNGFEVLMASYAMAHTKLEMVLREQGCDLGNRRPRIFLTNALEQHHPDTGTLFAQWLAAESVEADRIKRDTPVFVVIGNPPYSGESANKGEWIAKLLDAYKREPGGGKLKERNIKPLNDDYAKFIRYGQHFIDRAGYGVLAYINNNGFLDSPIFRGMRWSLLQSFDSIYIIDLHGTRKKKETASDGSPDKNVFDIQQGVSINLFVKTGGGESEQLARVYHRDLYGARESKYEYLLSHDLRQVNFTELTPQAPQYFFVPKDYELKGEYDRGFSVVDLFPVNGSGIVTKRDKLSIHHNIQDALQAAKDILNMEKDDFYRKYNLPPDVRDWRYEWARDDIEKFGVTNNLVRPICYRPFDVRQIVYTGKTRGFIGWPVIQVMRHFFAGENVGLVTVRNSRNSEGWREIFVSREIGVGSTTVTSLDKNFFFPLYLYPEEKQENIGDEVARKPNLNADIVQQIADQIGLRFVAEQTDADDTFAPVDILDYLYAVLHSPAYREKYREFLKIDFPRVPYPRDAKHFRALAKLGAELRTLHLLESPKLNRLITTYPQSGNNTVTRRLTKDDFEVTDPAAGIGRVHINATQYFGEVPQTAWNFPIGGYLPAQKYLKDRKSRALTWDEINHYQRMIVALVETAKLMQKIDDVF